MNKARRQELKNLKYKKRLVKIGMANSELLANPKANICGVNHNMTGYKSHSCPCSCMICSHRKYNRAKVKNDIYYKQDSQGIHV